MSKSDKDDWKILNRGLTWVKNTIKYKHVIGERSLSGVFTWIHEACYVNGKKRIHACGYMSMGCVIIHSKASKRKINV